jgi:uncharacterized membrane protein
MKRINLKQTFINGLFLALPLLAILYFGLKVVGIIEKIISPLANRVGIQHLLGELTLTIFALVILLMIFFILGILLHINVLRDINKQIEAVAYKLVPKLYKVKAFALSDDDDAFTKGWETVLLKDGDSWVPAYITEKSGEWISVFMPESPDGKSGQVKLIEAATTEYKFIDGMKLRSIIHHYGSGMIESVNNSEKQKIL